MVISCLTVYVIAFSSVILLGKSDAAMSPAPLNVTSRQNYRRSTKIHFQNNARTTNGSIDTVDVSKSDQKFPEVRSEQDKVLENYLPPSSLAKKLSKDFSHGNTKHSYFALYDPVSNVTRRWKASGKDLPLDIPRSDFDNFLQGEQNRDLYLGNLERGSRIKNFIEWDTLRDSEKEVRIHYNGITAKETVVKTGIDEETGRRQGLKLRQLTDGAHFIQLIYNFDNEIQDCEYIRQKTVIQKFLNSFRNNVENAKNVYQNELKDEELLKELEEEVNDDDDDDDDGDDMDYLEEDEGKIEKYPLDEDLEEYEGEDLNSEKEYRNVTFQVIRKDERLPKEFADWMNYQTLKRLCRENHKILKKLAYDRKHGDELIKKLAEEHIERKKRSLDFSLIFPGTKWCGKSHIAEKYTSLGGFSRTDICCRAHDHCHPLISAFEEKYGFYNFRPYTITHCRCDSRRKRDIMDVLLVPGTKWCGKGRRATKYTSLGGFSRTDKCCRVHDTMCPHWIGSLEEKYGLYNWRINTIMHCRCDKRFRACLKMAKTGTANFVGKLFFNVVQTKCFVLKPQEVCLQYSNWGNECERKGYRKKAYLRDNLSY